MTTDDAGAFLQRLEDDQEFALRMQEVSGNPEATHQRAADEGFDFTPDEMLEVLGDRYGIELTPEQLERSRPATTPRASSPVLSAGRCWRAWSSVPPPPRLRSSDATPRLAG